MRGTITVASVLIGVAAAGACSDEDDKKNPKGDLDAGSDGSLAGDGGSAGNSAAGTGAAGGTGGTSGGDGGTTGGSAGTTGGTGAAGGTGGTSGGSGGTGGMALICNTADAGATGGSAGQGTAGAGGGGPIGQWRDWAAYQCRDCPAPALNDCTDFDLAGSSTFDLGTRVFTVQVKPGVAEVVSATYELDWYIIDADGGSLSGPTSGSFTVDRDTLTADLSSTLPPEVTDFYGVRVTITDACGTTTNIVYGIINNPNPDGSPIINIHCEGAG